MDSTNDRNDDKIATYSNDALLKRKICLFVYAYGIFTKKILNNLTNKTH